MRSLVSSNSSSLWDALCIIDDTPKSIQQSMLLFRRTNWNVNDSHQVRSMNAGMSRYEIFILLCEKTITPSDYYGAWLFNRTADVSSKLEYMH